MILILLGPPGSGKGTQASRVAERLNVARIATGDLFRRAIAERTDYGRKAKWYVERGLLVPDELTIAMVRERLQQPDCGRGVVFDGFPRTREQAEGLDKAAGEMDWGVTQAIYLDVPREVIMERVTGRWVCRNCQASYHRTHNRPRQPGRCDICGGALHERVDDRPEIWQRRLEVYGRQTVPLLGFYRARGLLTEVDGNRPPDQVTEDLVAAVTARVLPRE